MEFLKTTFASNIIAIISNVLAVINIILMIFLQKDSEKITLIYEQNNNYYSISNKTPSQSTSIHDIKYIGIFILNYSLYCILYPIYPLIAMLLCTLLIIKYEKLNILYCRRQIIVPLFYLVIFFIWDILVSEKVLVILDTLNISSSKFTFDDILDTILSKLFILIDIILRLSQEPIYIDVLFSIVFVVYINSYFFYELFKSKNKMKYPTLKEIRNEIIFITIPFIFCFYSFFHPYIMLIFEKIMLFLEKVVLRILNT